MNDRNMQQNSVPQLRGRQIEIKDMPTSITEQMVDENENATRVVGVRLSKTGRIWAYAAGSIDLHVNDSVIVDLPEKGPVLGWVAEAPLMIKGNAPKNLKPVLRKASDDDLKRREQQERAESVGVEKAQRSINKFNLPMRVLKVEYTLDLRNATVYFVSENRVDFRELLKDLIHDLKARVELRQVGVRDQTRMEGALGPCGEETCCSRFINRFHGVSIKMAKDQELSLKPTKVSGMCGRLKCCLAYEHQVYSECLKSVPPRGCVVCCGDKQGVIQEIDILRQKITMITPEGAIITASASEVQRVAKSEVRGELAALAKETKKEEPIDEDLLIEDDESGE